MDKLVLYNKAQFLYIYVNTYVLSSFPKVHVHYKIKLEDTLSSLIENITYANFNNGNIRKKYIKDVLVNISIIDFYVGIMYKLKIIKIDRYKRILKLNDELKALTFGWMKNEESKC